MSQAGLFSAVVTGFGVLAYTVLAAASDPADVSVLHPYVAALWFAALVCGLAAAVVAISVNQWLNYLLTPAGLVEFGPRQKLRIWNLRRSAFQRWHVDFMLGIPPVLLQMAVTLFLVALAGFLWSLSISIAIPSLALVCLVVLFQLTTLIVPAIVVYSPFQSPQAQWARLIWINVLYACALAVHAVASKVSQNKQPSRENHTTQSIARSATTYQMTSFRQKRRQPREGSRLARCHRRSSSKHRNKMQTLERLITYLSQLRKRCDWVMNEKLYLDDPAHTEDVDSTLFAATFAATVTRDDKSFFFFF